ncbi:TRAP transporter substrate-binding protein DctP [Candidatus Marinimicrobia bacterium]|nr:TRAP transporter substrate-binding protein DctP [Candidatus Neomarinimicrobiota bacterium]
MKRNILIIVLCLSVQLLWGKKIIVKMATLAPEGTDWHGLLVDLGQQWKEATDGEVRLRIYPGGVVGDERDMIRKMRIGQIHGAAITNEGMTEINPYFTAFYMPMMYQSYEEVDFVRKRLNDELYDETEKNGFKILTMVDVGWVYWFSNKPVYTPEDLKKLKIFTWAGDYKSGQLYEKHGYQPVPLAITDVLSGLQTGLINTLAFNPMYALSQQLFGIADNMLNMKWGNMTAAIVIDNRTWNRIKPEYQSVMLDISQNIGNGFQKKNRHETNKAIDVMKEYGLTVNTPTPDQVKKWEDLIERMYPDLRGSLIDEVTFDRLMEIKKEMDSLSN